MALDETACLAAIAESFPAANVTVDWFHVGQLFTTALDEVRKAEAKQRKRPKATRGAVLKAADGGRLTIKQQKALDELESGGFATATAWRLKEMFRWVRKASPPRAALAHAHPGLSFIAAHGGSLYGWDRLEPLMELDNVYFDLAYLNGLIEPEALVKIIRQKGPERVIYGSDAPWRDPMEFRAWFEDLPLTAGEREQIMAGTLLELLGEG